jgi:hypothetical protein
MLEYAALVVSPRALTDGLILVFQHPDKAKRSAANNFANRFVLNYQYAVCKVIPGRCKLHSPLIIIFNRDNNLNIFFWIKSIIIFFGFFHQQIDEP